MSTNFYSGYAPDKPTSKVLNPPGGRSNNIFGGYDEETTSKPVRLTPAQQHQQQFQQQQMQQQQQENVKPQLSAQQQAVLNKQHQVTGTTNILGATAEAGQHHLSHHQQQQQHHQQQQVQQHQQQTQQHQQQQQQQAQTQQNRSKRSGFNPITGEEYGEELHSPVKQAPEVVAAPVQEQADEQKPGSNFHPSSRVLQPPGGKSTKLW